MPNEETPLVGESKNKEVGCFEAFFCGCCRSEPDLTLYQQAGGPPARLEQDVWSEILDGDAISSAILHVNDEKIKNLCDRYAVRSVKCLKYRYKTEWSGYDKFEMIVALTTEEHSEAVVCGVELPVTFDEGKYKQGSTASVDWLQKKIYA